MVLALVHYILSTTIYLIGGDWKKLLCGVPQGSVLGPLLFLILIGDIDNELTSAFLSSFADDTRMGHKTDTHAEKTELQSDLNTVYRWTSRNNMELHGDKFEHMHYSGKPTKDRPPAHSFISSSGLVIEEKTHIDNSSWEHCAERSRIS